MSNITCVSTLFLDLDEVGLLDFTWVPGVLLAGFFHGNELILTNSLAPKLGMHDQQFQSSFISPVHDQGFIYKHK